MKQSIHIRKDALKFASAHMTVFPDGSKEALHGHNYQVFFSAEIKGDSLKAMTPFADIKKNLKTLCEAWDEKVLLAASCPHFKVLTRSPNLEFELCKKKYSLPADEVELLLVDNITTETLSRLFAQKLVKMLRKAKNLNSIEIRIEEAPGQGASVQISL